MTNYSMVPQVDKIKNKQDYEYIVISEDEKSQGPDLKYYLRIMKRRRWLIVFPLLLIMPVLLILLSLERPVYKATTKLMIEYIDTKGNEISRTVSEDFYNTQYAIIKSRAILGEVVQTLQLDNKSNSEKNFLVQIKDMVIDFPGMIIEKTIDVIAELSNSKGSTRKYSDTPSTIPVNFTNSRLDSAIARLKRELTITPVKDTKLVDISVEGPDPLEATRQVDTVVDVYIKRNLEEKLDSTKKAIHWLKGEADTLREKVRKSQSSLQEFNENKKLVFNENNEGKNL